MALRDHLGADQHGPVCALGSARCVSRKRAGPRGGVGVEADPLELGNVPLELLLEPLGARADVRELGRPAGRAGLRYRLAMPAVMAMEPSVAVQRQRDVAVPAAARQRRRPGSGSPASRLAG